MQQLGCECVPHKRLSLVLSLYSTGPLGTSCAYFGEGSHRYSVCCEPERDFLNVRSQNDVPSTWFNDHRFSSETFQLSIILGSISCLKCFLTMGTCTACFFVCCTYQCIIDKTKTREKRVMAVGAFSRYEVYTYIHITRWDPLIIIVEFHSG